MFYQIAALIIMAAFYGCYFTKSLLQRRQGIQTNLLGKGKTGLPKLIELSLKLVSFLVPIIELLSIFGNYSTLPSIVRVCGLLLGGVGLVFFILSVTTMRDNWRAGVPQEKQTNLVTTGIYRISRNPAFLGFDFIYLGLLLAFFNLPLLCVTLAALQLFHLQIVNVEEDFLIATFGEEYLQYQKHVCRYLGRK